MELQAGDGVAGNGKHRDGDVLSGVKKYRELVPSSERLRVRGSRSSEPLAGLVSGRGRPPVWWAL